MVTYANVEGVLEKRREKARADPTTFDGPRVALVGPTDVGKSSVSKILCNYAVRKGWHPLFVDLDLGQNGIATPATVGAVPVDRPIDPSEGFARARRPGLWCTSTATPVRGTTLSCTGISSII